MSFCALAIANFVEHRFGPIGRQGGHHVHPLGLASFGLRFIEPADRDELASVLDQEVVNALARLVSGGRVPNLIATAQRSCRGRDLVGIVLEDAVGQFPFLDLQRDRLRLLELAVFQRRSGLLSASSGPSGDREAGPAAFPLTEATPWAGLS